MQYKSWWNQETTQRGSPDGLLMIHQETIQSNIHVKSQTGHHHPFYSIAILQETQPTELPIRDKIDLSGRGTTQALISITTQVSTKLSNYALSKISSEPPSGDSNVYPGSIQSEPPSVDPTGAPIIISTSIPSVNPRKDPNRDPINHPIKSTRDQPMSIPYTLNQGSK